MYSVINKRKEVVELLLNHPNIDVNARTEEGITALIIAAELGYKDIVEILLNYPKIDVNAQYEKGTALIRAAFNNHKEVVELLLNRPNIDVNVLIKGIGTALILAVGENHKEIVKMLLTHPKIDVNMQYVIGEVPLLSPKYTNKSNKIQLDILSDILVGMSYSEFLRHFNNKRPINASALTLAAAKGYKEIVELLLNRPDIDVNICFPDLALVFAVQGGHLEIVEMLLNHPQINVFGGEIYLGLAESGGHTEVFELLSRHPKIVNDEDMADRLGNLAMLNNENAVEFLLKQGADVNKRDIFGLTPLMYAAEAGNARIVKLLLDQPGIDVNIKGYGETALDYAKRTGRRSVIRLIQSKMGLQSQSFDPFREKVKHLPGEKIYEEFWKAISRGDINEMDSFRDEDGKILVDINKRNENGDTALIMASDNGNLNAVKWLLECNADLSIKDANGDNALIRAAKKGHLDVTEELLYRKVNIVNSIGQHKKTALMAAAENGHIRVVKLLLKKGAKVSIKDDYDKTTLDIVNEKLLCNADNNYKSIKCALENVMGGRSKSFDLPIDDEMKLPKKWEVVTNECEKDLKSWEKDDPDTHKKIQILIKHIEIDPFRGKGQVERLTSDLEGLYSRRINKQNRLVYEIDGEKVILKSCKGHYEKEKRKK